MSRYQFRPDKVEFPPVPEHPYQQALRGEPCHPPDGLTERARAEWVRKWEAGDQQRRERQ